MSRHCCLLAWTSGLSKLSQKDEERKEILHESVKHAILYEKIPLECDACMMREER